MPPLPTEGDLPEGDLAAAVVALSSRVAALNRHMEYMVDEKVQTKVETEIAAKSIPREEYLRRVKASGKRVIAGMVVLLVLLGVAVWWNRAAVTRSQRACEGRNDQSRQSKMLLERFAVAEQEENKELAADYVALARRAVDPERRQFLVLLSELELKRDRATAGLFRELAANVRIQDC
jgi:hypothetical protein